MKQAFPSNPPRGSYRKQFERCFSDSDIQIVRPGSAAHMLNPKTLRKHTGAKSSGNTIVHSVATVAAGKACLAHLSLVIEKP